MQKHILDVADEESAGSRQMPHQRFCCAYYGDETVKCKGEYRCFR